MARDGMDLATKELAFMSDGMERQRAVRGV